MPFRSLVISSSASITTKNNQLVIKTDDSHSVPIEDIQAILLENQNSVISVYSLQKLIASGVTVYICDEKHLPSAVFIPFYQHSRNVAVMRSQENLTAPQKKKIWQQIVVAKIMNQARCLELIGNEGFEHLEYLAKTVNSGDTHNVEAVAANYYFKMLFGKDFNRSGDDTRNAALNYGYAIMRGLVARLLTGYGVLPMKGIHHSSEQNSFNLAYDFMEPLRPVVDLFVAETVRNGELLTPEIKHCLFNLLNVDVISNSQLHSLNYATERMIQSFLRYCHKTTAVLYLPELIKLRQHKYE